MTFNTRKLRKLLLGILSFFLTINSFGQNETEKMHQQFLQYLEIEKVDSIYNSLLIKNENDEGYEEALLYRNQYGWALNNIEQLKKDIPAILNLQSYSSELSYEKIFRPQEFPPFEWHRFYEMSIELEKHFESDSTIHREILGIKTMLAFLTMNDNALLIDLPKLLSQLKYDSDAYSALFWHYGNTLMRTNDSTKAQKVFEKGLELNDNNKFLKSLIRIHTHNKDFEKVLSYEEQILADSSGILLYNLALAHLKNNDTTKADKYFRFFISKLEYVDYEPFAVISHKNNRYHLDPSQLETLGDFFIDSDMELSCNFYHIALKVLSNSNEDRFFKKQMMAIQDETKKKDMNEKYEKHKKEQQELLHRISSKIENCL